MQLRVFSRCGGLEIARKRLKFSEVFRQPWVCFYIGETTLWINSYKSPPENPRKTGNTFIPEDSQRCRVPSLCRKLAACQENLQQFQQQFEDGFGAGGVIFSPAGMWLLLNPGLRWTKKIAMGGLTFSFAPFLRQNMVTCFVLGCGHVKPRPRLHVTTRISQSCVNGL